uniref:Serrate, RNA effector molecule n=1 Tax=Sphaeramia orbicularis TaxID=375764 RepID=A0A673BZU7_9TELE
MGDSDDEYDRRRRDKFRRERSDYDRSREREDRRRDDWNDREWDRGRERRSRGEYRDYERGRRERFSPPRHDMSPQQKHVIVTKILYFKCHFKEFLLSLDDSVDETEAVKRYNEYKIDFRRQQMQEFFLAHKDEEWFRSKYHPDEASRLKAEAQSALHNRLNVFMFLMENGWFDGVSLDIEHMPAIIKVLDAAVIKMEGGTDHDLRILDLPSEEDEDREKAVSGGTEPTKREDVKSSDGDRKPSVEKDKNEKVRFILCSLSTGNKNFIVCYYFHKQEKMNNHLFFCILQPRRKRKRSGDSDDEASASESESDSDSDSNSNWKPKENTEDEKKEEKKPKDDSPRPRPLHRTCSLFMRSIAPTISKAEIIALCRRYPGFLRVCLSDPHPERRLVPINNLPRKSNFHIIVKIFLRDCELAPGVNRDLARRVRNVNGITQHKQVLRNDIKLAAKLIHALDEKGDLWSSKTQEDGQSTELPAQNPILTNITDYLIEEVSAEEEELLGTGSGMDPEEGSKEGNPAETTVERDDKLAKVLDRLVLYLRVVHSIDYYNTCEYPSEDEMPNRCGMIHVRGPIPPNRITHGEVQQWQKMMEEKLSPLFSLKEILSEEEAVKMGRKDPEEEVEKFVSANTQELGKDKWLCPLSGKKFKGPEFVRKHILNKHGDKIEEVKKEVVFFNNFLMDAKRPSLPEMKLPPLPGPGQGLLSPTMPFPPQGPQGPMGFGQPRPPLMGYGAGGPPYPPNQYGGGRGNYDNFRGQGGYLGKPRNIRMSRGDPRNIIEYRDLDAPDDMDFF